MHIILLLAFILGVVFLPGWWVRHVLAKYSRPENRYPGTGGQLARHLLDRHGLEDVPVEASEAGDHYDPRDRVVRLTPDKLNGRSLTAVTVAAHEVGHALQDRDGYAPLRARTHLVGTTQHLQRLGAGLLMASPFIGILTRAPVAGLLVFAGGFLSLGSSALVHLVTLPTEYDASFRRALPLLEREEILKDVDRPHARRLLKAAALTYLAASLMSLLNVAQWWAILRR